MKLLVLSLTYRNVPFAELERVSIPVSALAGTLPTLVQAPEVLEAVILSTCNRTEVYAWGREPEATSAHLRERLERLGGFAPGELPSCTLLEGDEALRHLFLVTAGLDSMVQGESEIQGQVRQAYRVAASVGTVGPHLDRLFRWALEAGRRARTETGLSRAADSLPRAAARAIAAGLGALAERHVLVVGAGKVAAGSLRALVAAGATATVVARSPEAAEAIAGKHGASIVPLSALEDALGLVDGAVFATAAPHPILRAASVERILAERDGRKLVVVDLGLPRNVEPEAALADGDGRLALFDLERLDREGFTGERGREAQLARSTEIVLEEGDRCAAWFRSRPAEAVVAAIRELADRVASAEGARAIRKAPGVDVRQQAVIEEAIRRGIRKIVHLPTVRAKEACSNGDLEILEAVRWLFALEADGRGNGSDDG